MTTVTAVDLASRLRAWARGSGRVEAAVELLIAHGVWLRRADFLDCCVTDFDGVERDGTEAAMADVDFDAVDGFLGLVDCTPSEACVLRIAASLALADGGMADRLPGVGRTTLALVFDVLAHAAYWHESGWSYTVTGLPGGE
jgi:hypothetical protein